MQGGRLRSSDPIDGLFGFRVLGAEHAVAIGMLAPFCDNHTVDAFSLRAVLSVAPICHEEQDSLVVRIPLLHSTLCCNMVTDVDQKP